MISMSRRVESRVSPAKPDVARIGDDAVLAPFLQHGTVFGDLVLPLLGLDQVVRIDVFQPEERPLDPRLRRLLDEIGDLVAQRIDLDSEADVHAFLEPQLDQPVEQRLTLAIASEIVLGYVEAGDALGDI